MQILTVKKPEGPIIIELNDPTFDQIRGALLAGETPSGKFDRVAAGNFFIVACVTDKDREKLDVLNADPKAQASAALEASTMLYGYETELKKK